MQSFLRPKYFILFYFRFVTISRNSHISTSISLLFVPLHHFLFLFCSFLFPFHYFLFLFHYYLLKLAYLDVRFATFCSVSLLFVYICINHCPFHIAMSASLLFVPFHHFLFPFRYFLFPFHYFLFLFHYYLLKLAYLDVRFATFCSVSLLYVYICINQ